MGAEFGGGGGGPTKQNLTPTDTVYFCTSKPHTIGIQGAITKTKTILETGTSTLVNFLLKDDLAWSFSRTVSYTQCTGYCIKVTSSYQIYNVGIKWYAPKGLQPL